MGLSFKFRAGTLIGDSDGLGPEFCAGAFAQETSEVALLIKGLIEHAITWLFSMAFPGSCSKVEEKFSSVIRGTLQDRGRLMSGVQVRSNASRIIDASELVSTACE